MTLTIRWAQLPDYPEMKAYDEFIGDRRLDLQAGELVVADQDGRKAVGYLRVAATAFLGWPLVTALCVHPDHRRSRVASRLLDWLGRDGRFPRLYISTEDGNEAMRGLLGRIEARQIGYADALNMNEEREILYRLR